MSGLDADGVTIADPMASGRAALAEHAWEQARQHFEAALSREETPEALEGLSWAAWWLGDADALFEARESAYRAYQAAGRSRDAARMATWLGTDSVDFRGELALAEGWLGRARRLLEGSEPSAEQGWLCVHEAEKRLFADDTERARALGEEATRLGRQLGIVDLEMMGLATVGLALVTEGAVDEGISRLGEAAAAALAEDFSELWSAGWCCCYMLYGCERVRDYDRATQWSRRVEAWAERMQIGFINRTCRAHYADVLIWRGTWSDAEETLVEAAARLAEVRPPMAVEAQVRLGELRRRQGRFTEAAEIFDAAAEHPLALLGTGELCLDHDDPTGAVDRAEQYLREIPPSSATQPAAGLELLVWASVALGDLSGRRLPSRSSAPWPTESRPIRSGRRPHSAVVPWRRAGATGNKPGSPSRTRSGCFNAARPRSSWPGLRSR